MRCITGDVSSVPRMVHSALPKQDVYDRIEDVMETICRMDPAGGVAATSPVNGGG